MTGTIFLGGIARRKASGARSRFAGAFQDQHAGRPVPPQARGKRCFSKISGEKEPGYGAWGPGSQKLGAGASRGLGPGPGVQATRAAAPIFRRSEKSPGGRQAKGWETAETAAAFLGCKGEKKRVFTLSVAETIQHAPQGRRTFIAETETTTFNSHKVRNFFSFLRASIQAFHVRNSTPQKLSSAGSEAILNSVPCHGMFPES